jgi:hypothetical protein
MTTPTEQALKAMILEKRGHLEDMQLLPDGRAFEDGSRLAFELRKSRLATEISVLSEVSALIADLTRKRDEARTC